MIELPEAVVLARQLGQTVGKRITHAVAGASPHGFAWYLGDPAGYGELLDGRRVTGTASHGGLPEIWAGDVRLCVGDGVNLRYLPAGTTPPAKHQLLVVFDDASCLVGTVQMYGGIWAFREGENDNPYYLVAQEKPSPLDPAFDKAYFDSLLAGADNLSAKAFLATQQRIPGLGNGVLQDILWTAQVHPKRKLATLPAERIDALYAAVRTVLARMTAQGGRDTEKDLFGRPGGYATILSRTSTLCPRCGTPIARQSYLGGNVYICPACQSTGEG